MKTRIITAAVSILLSVTGFPQSAFPTPSRGYPGTNYAGLSRPPTLLRRPPHPPTQGLGSNRGNWNFPHNRTGIIAMTNVEQTFINQGADAGTQSAPDATQSDPVQYYEIVSVQSGNCLDVRGGPDAVQVHAAIQQWQFAGADNQIWRLVPTGDGYFEIFSKDTNLCLDVPWGSLDNSTRIQLCNVLGGDNQRWSLVPAGNGSVLIVGKRSGKCLNVAWGSMDSGADIVQYSCEYTPNEKWQLIPLGAQANSAGN